jgi:hypothetical protein
MTYPPQQPGPYDPYGQRQQPGPPHDPYAPQSGYQMLGGSPGGGYPGEGEPPKKRRTGLIVAVVVIAVLVLGGAGTGLYFLVKNDDKGDNTGNRADDPSTVTAAYIEAYQTKSFGSVVNNACKAYKEKWGTQTTQLERRLRQFDVKATADGEPDVSGSSATAKIDIELIKDGRTEQRHKIEITMSKEDGAWRFCGENAA